MVAMAAVSRDLVTREVAVYAGGLALAALIWIGPDIIRAAGRR